MEKLTFRGFNPKLPIDKIDISDSNVRKSQRNAGLEELKASVNALNLIQPVIVIQKGDRYRLIVGQRRYLAFKEMGKTTIPALIINPLSEARQSMVSFTENIHRRALPYDDTIRVCSELFEEYPGPKMQRTRRIALELAISPQTVARYLSYKLVPEELQTMVAEGELSRVLAFKITTAFWPNTGKIVRIAKSAARLTKLEKQRVLEFGRKNPKASVEEIIEEAKKPSRLVEIVVPIDPEHYNLLEQIAKKRQMDIPELIMSQINELLSEEEVT